MAIYRCCGPKWRRGWGLQTCALTPDLAADTVTAIRTPDGVAARDVLRKAYDRYNASFGSGLAPLDGRVFRIGHIGDSNEGICLTALALAELALAALIAHLFSFPAAASDIPVTVNFLTNAMGRETWARSFAVRPMVSTQEAGTGRNQHLITERFGPFAFGLALVTAGQKLRIIPRRWSLCGLPLPRALMPKGDSYETQIDGKFRFHVEIALPLIGPVVTYDGWLEPA